MKYIVDRITRKPIGSIVTNHTMSLEDALRLIGAEIVNPEPGEPDVILDGERYWTDDLELADAPSLREFVESLYNNADRAEPIDLDTAAEDLRNFETDGWILPEGITPESYRDAWNALVAEEA